METGVSNMARLIKIWNSNENGSGGRASDPDFASRGFESREQASNADQCFENSLIFLVNYYSYA